MNDLTTVLFVCGVGAALFVAVPCFVYLCVKLGTLGYLRAVDYYQKKQSQQKSGEEREI